MSSFLFKEHSYHCTCLCLCRTYFSSFVYLFSNVIVNVLSHLVTLFVVCKAI